MALSSHEIDQIAQNTFRNSIPPAWLKREQHPDFFLDYYIEIFKDNEPSGSIFAVQLKGQELPKISNNYVKYSMKKKHLHYYQEKAKFPVFLFVVDVVNKKCWYLFLQKYLQDAISNNKWNGKKGLTVNIPIDNDAANHVKLLRSIQDAELFMNNLRPGSIDAAIDKATSKYTKIDNRFEVGVEVKNKATKYVISPKPGVDVDVRVAFHTTNEKLDDLLGRGKQVEFSPNELEFFGSDLFESITNEIDPSKTIMVKAGNEFDGAVTVSCIRKKRELYTLHGIIGKIRGGYKEINFEGNLPNSPLSITLSFPLPTDKSKKGTGTFNIGFDADKWEGQPVSLLSYFNQVYKWIDGLRTSDQVRFECEVGGNLLVGAKVESRDLSIMSSTLIDTLDLIKKTRVISAKLDFNLTMPKYSLLKRNDVEQINFLYDLVMKGESIRSFASGNLSVKITELIIAPDKIKEMAESNKSLLLDFITPNIDLFGFIIPNWVIKYEVTEPRVTSISQDASTSTEAEIKLEGSKNSKLIYRLCQIP